MSAAENRTMEKPTQERRNVARHRARKTAHITFKGHWATIDCTVFNLSDQGACLQVESPIGIPDTFDLVLDHASVRDCRVTWRKATRIGVAFA
jgi:PilZ domain